MNTASVANQLAGALGRRDEQPNIELARRLADNPNQHHISELVGLLTSGTKPQRHDAIKALYELTERRPDLLKDQTAHLVGLLATKDNRLLWGLLSALSALADVAPKTMMQHLDAILDAADRSSVIAKDKTMSLLAKLNGHKQFANLVTPILLHRLRHAAVNQTPMYAELTATTMPEANWPEFAKIVEMRLNEISYPAKRKRLAAILNRE